MCCFILYKFRARTTKIEYLSNTEFPGTENVKLSWIQTGYNYKQKDLIQDLVMQDCKMVVCKFDIQRGWIVYIQQSANYWKTLTIVKPYNYQWGSQLTIINTTEKKKKRKKHTLSVFRFLVYNLTFPIHFFSNWKTSPKYFCNCKPAKSSWLLINNWPSDEKKAVWILKGVIYM